MFLSKYALNGGIKEHKIREDVRHVRPSDGFVGLDGFFAFTTFKVGRDVHHTREEAVKAADAMRVKRIKSLEKQLAALRAMTF